MSNDCLVKTCKTNLLQGKQREKRFVKFPTIERFKQKWINLLQIDTKDIDESSKVCTKHFLESQLVNRFKESDIISIPQKSLPISIEEQRNAPIPARLAVGSDEQVAGVSDDLIHTPDGASGVRRSTRKTKQKLDADEQPIPKRAKTTEDEPSPIVTRATAIKQENVDDVKKDVSETDSCVALLGNVKPDATDRMLTVKTEPPEQEVTIVPIDLPVSTSAFPPKILISSPRSLAQAIPKTVTASTAARPIHSLFVPNVPNVVPTTSTVGCRPIVKISQTTPIVNDVSITPIVPLPVPTTSNQQPNKTITITQLQANQSIALVKQYGGIIAARRNSTGPINLANKQKIVVNAHNIELIKKALSKKKLVCTRPKDPNLQPTITAPLRLVAPQTLMAKRDEPAPAVNPSQPNSYPVNIIPIQSPGPVPAARPTISGPARLSISGPSTLSIHPKISTPKVVAIRPNNPKPNGTMTVVKNVAPKKTNPDTQQVANSIKPSSVALKKSNPPTVVILDEDANKTNPNKNNHITFKPAARVMSDVDLDIDFRLSNEHDLPTTQTQLNVVARVVNALRSEMDTHKVDNKHMRAQLSKMHKDNVYLRNQLNKQQSDHKQLSFQVATQLDDNKRLREQNAFIMAQNAELSKKLQIPPAIQQPIFTPSIGAPMVKPTAPYPVLIANATTKATVNPSPTSTVKPNYPTNSNANKFVPAKSIVPAKPSANSSANKFILPKASAPANYPPNFTVNSGKVSVNYVPSSAGSSAKPIQSYVGVRKTMN